METSMIKESIVKSILPEYQQALANCETIAEIETVTELLSVMISEVTGKFNRDYNSAVKRVMDQTKNLFDHFHECKLKSQER